MYKIILLLLFVFHYSISIAATYSCSHHEICRLAEIISTENAEQTNTYNNLIILNGDPHEFEPSINDIKKLMAAPFLIVGPSELNPWMKKISYLRSQNKKLKTITLSLPSFAKSLYGAKDTEALGHFWLYPKIYCHMKNDLTIQLGLKTIKSCNSDSIESALKSALAKIKTPMILTHDALLPLLTSLSSKTKVLAIKGSSHHEEVSSQMIKNIYNALKEPKVIWLLEDNIIPPQNVKEKIRPTDIVITIDTAKSKSKNDDFEILHNLLSKINEIKP